MTKHTTRTSSQEIPYGYCHCGCGQKTRIPTKNITKDKQVKGVPLRYLPGHQFGKRLLAEAFWQHVDKQGPDDCWPWLGYRHPTGYGRFKHANKAWSAHRASYVLHKGNIPPGAHVCHACDNPSCVNPAHLWLGTARDNNADKQRKGRQARHEGHGMARLTSSDVRLIRMLRACGWTLLQLADAFEMSQTHASEIVRHKSWRDLE